MDKRKATNDKAKSLAYVALFAALTLVLAGGASNLYDRLKRGYVVDYFSIQWKKLKKVVFNLGDIFIFAGSALFAAVQLVEEVREILPKEKIFVKEEE